MMHKIVSAVLGVLSACAGLVALVASDVTLTDRVNRHRTIGKRPYFLK